MNPRFVNHARRPKEETLPVEKQFFISDATLASEDDSCRMKFWYRNLERGIGIIRKDDLLPALLDKEIHNDLRQIAEMEDLSAPNIQHMFNTQVLQALSAEDRQDSAKMELLWRRLGLVAAWALYIEPQLRIHYATVPAAVALVGDRDPLWVVAYPDRILQHRTTGELVYRELVPIGGGINKTNWQQSWHYNIRAHLGIAIAKENDLDVSYAEIIGMNYGFRSILDQRLVHPYVWCWHNEAKDEWTHSLTSVPKDDWKLVPAWTFPGGIVTWVMMLGRAMAESQFWTSAPVYLNKTQVSDWVARRLHREREIKKNLAESQQNSDIRRVYFGKMTGSCYEPGGDKCPYLHCCWGTDDAVQSGKYVPMPLALKG